MDKSDFLEENISRLVGSKAPELKILQPHQQLILNELIKEAKTLSTTGPIKKLRLRTITRRIVTLATAAGVIAAVLLGIIVLEKTTVPAYAIEQTIKAVAQVYTVHIIGTNWDGNRFEAWNKINPQTGKAEWCCNDETPYGYKIASTPKGSCVWDANGNVVRYSNQQIASNDLRYEYILEELSERIKNPSDDEKITIYTEKDPVTGKDTIVIWAITKLQDFKVYIDPVTKLPVRLYFDRADNMPQICKSIDQIFYNVDLPEGMFDFEVPEKWHRDWTLLSEPDKGLPIGDLTHEEGAIKTAKQYWQAVIENNWQYADQLRPVADWKTDYHKDRPAELIDIKTPYPHRGCTGLITPCIVRFDDGKIMEVKLVINYRQINAQASTIIVATWGRPKVVDVK